MKITVMTSLFTKGDVEVDTSHGVVLFLVRDDSPRQVVGLRYVVMKALGTYAYLASHVLHVMQQRFMSCPIPRGSHKYLREYFPMVAQHLLQGL